MARKVNKHHYLASPTTERDLEAVHRGYSTDGEESQYAASSRQQYQRQASPASSRQQYQRQASPALSRQQYQRQASPASSRQQYQRQASPASSRQQYQRQASPASSRQQYQPPGQRRDDDGSDIYVTSAAYRAPSELSRYSDVSVRSKKSRKGALTVETMSAPNPFCPNTRGICCLMLLLNLGIVLVTLGFIIVIQFYKPVFVWILGVVFLVFGFMTLVGSLLYCVHVCRDAKSPSQLRPEDLYWTRHWQKTIGGPPEIHYQPHERPSDRYETQSHRSNGRY